MDAGGDFERVLKRQKFVSQEASSTLDKILLGLSAAKESVLTKGSPGDSLGKLRDFSTKVLESHKDFQSALAKFSKNTDKKYFKADLNAIWNPRAFGDKTDALNRALAHHFTREGLFDVEQVFEDEAGVPYLSNDFKNQFNGMFAIQKALKDGDLSLALNWAAEHSLALEARGSTLEFQLHRLKFIKMLAEPNRTQDCLAYARSNLSKFSKKHMAGGLFYRVI